MKRRTVCHVMAALFSVLVIIPLVFSIADRDPPFDLTDGHTVPATLTPGKPYQFSWLRTPVNPRHCTGTVFWVLVDSQNTIWATPPGESLFTAMDNSTSSRIVGRERILPSGIAPGPIRLRASMEFVCNWTHHLWPVKRTFPEVRSIVQ